MTDYHFYLTVLSFGCIVPFLYLFFFFQIKTERMSLKRKRASDGVNEDIVDVLLELAEWETNTNRATHKANAYRKAAAVVGAVGHR